MAKPPPRKWQQQTIKLPADHGWKGTPGYNVFVADRGAVQFHFPEKWLVIPGDDGSIGFHDAKPPADNCALRVSVMHLPREIPWQTLDREMPVDRLVEQVIADDTRDDAKARGLVRTAERPDLKLAWGELTFIDPGERRPARSRVCLARGKGTQPLLTMDYWDDEAATYEPVWDEVLKSLKLGLVISDITRRNLN